jgi:hypothetical protein
VKIRGADLELKTLETLGRCLQGIPFIKAPPSLIRADGHGMEPLFRARVAFSDGDVWFLLLCSTIGHPKQARIAVNQLLRLRESYPDFYGIFVAPYVSPQAADVCSEAGIGHLDFGGNCRISFGRVHIEKKGNPNLFADRRDLRSLYSPKASRILRVLLSNPQKPWRIQALAYEATVSVGLVSKVKKLLADREWLGEDAAGIVLTDPHALLNEWSGNYSYDKNEIRYFYSPNSVIEIESAIGEVFRHKGITYALTGLSGSSRIAPFVRHQRVTVYVAGLAEDTLVSANLKPVDSGANVSLLIPYDSGVFYGCQDIRGARVAAPIQVYLDLVRYPGRGKEAAKHLYEHVIERIWQIKKTT